MKPYNAGDVWMDGGRQAHSKFNSSATYSTLILILQTLLSVFEV